MKTVFATWADRKKINKHKKTDKINENIRTAYSKKINKVTQLVYLTKSIQYDTINKSSSRKSKLTK